jgi:hypothetical protein
MKKSILERIASLTRANQLAIGTKVIYRDIIGNESTCTLEAIWRSTCGREFASLKNIKTGKVTNTASVTLVEPA